MPPKKKKRRPRARAQAGRAAAGPGAEVERPDPNEKRRERLEARREEKARAAAAQRRRQARNRIVRLVVMLTVSAVFVWFFFLRTQLPNAIAGNPIEDFRTFTAESRTGELHTDGDVTYESTPPVSGNHAPQPGVCGLHDEPMPDETMVHNLEHGAVGILYQPDLAPADIKDIERLVGTFDSHVFSMPYPEMETPITVVAWAHLMRLDAYDEDAITEFIEVFRQGGDSPEKQDCDMDGDDAFDPSQQSPTASPSPKRTKKN